MQGLSFSLLDKVNQTAEYCEIHSDCPLVQVDNHTPFCQLCVKNETVRRNNKLVSKAIYRDYRRNFHGVLKYDSIFDEEELRDVSFKSYIVDPGSEAETNLVKARQIAGRYLDRNYKANTIITGMPGVGKSHLAASMLRAVNENIEPNASCLFVSINELMRLIKDSFNNKESRYTEACMVKLLGNVNLLVLDDLGSESSFKRENREASEWVQQVLFGILNKRKRTIITTNLNSDELSKIYNPKLLSRMYKGIEKGDSIIKFTEKTEDKRKVVF